MNALNSALASLTPASSQTVPVAVSGVYMLQPDFKPLTGL